mmetsp:Transcript_65945/g.169728  ORF Transcript_65945/g.169728 Transcript_65945/m.169728 type:complete len:610 (-) Transcript_65945:83-1912(-)
MGTTQCTAQPAVAEEEDDYLRSQIAYLKQGIRHEEESIYTLTCQQKKKRRQEPPTLDEFMKDLSKDLKRPNIRGEGHKATATRLEKIIQDMERYHAELQKLGSAMFLELQASSTLTSWCSNPTNPSVKGRPSLPAAVNKVASALGSIGMITGGTTELPPDEVLIGAEEDYGLTWDRRFEGATFGPRDEGSRKRIRDSTRNKVTSELGLQYFGARVGDYARQVPRIGSTALFIDRSLAAFEGFAPAGNENLLGRYDVCCVKVCADYDRNWEFIKGGKKPRSEFFVAHAAAVNIGESVEAADWPDFADEEAVNPDASNDLWVNFSNWWEGTTDATGPPTYSGTLDEKKYLTAMGQIMTNVVEASERLGVDHFLFFPFGMGAFLRHLGLIDPRFTTDEEMQRLRRALAKRFIDVLAARSGKYHIHLCLSFGADETMRNADAFLRALLDKSAANLRKRVTVWPEGDSLDLANTLAEDSDKVVLVNGANRRLLGNHWFAGRAKLAIDENLHRRSWRMCATSYVLNGYDGQEPWGRFYDTLHKRVLDLAGPNSVMILGQEGKGSGKGKSHDKRYGKGDGKGYGDEKGAGRGSGTEAASPKRHVRHGESSGSGYPR